MVMIGALLVLLLTALLPGPVGWLVGGGQAGEPERDPGPGSGRERAAAAATMEGVADLTPGQSAPTGPSLGEERERADREAMSDSAAGETGGVLAVGNTNPVDPCSLITSQLRQEGAAYYRLESWESEPRVFRFQCTLPVSQAPVSQAPIGQAEEETKSAYRTFEAAGNNPAEAMERVLADVRAWNASGRY
jgi:hypothetical protein